MSISFGTDGIRSRIGVSPLTATHLPALGNAIATWLRTTDDPGGPVLIGMDTRCSGDWIATTLTSQLLLHGIDVQNAGMLPTPVVVHAVTKTDCYACGLMVSASHNPHHDNGIKLICPGTGKPSDEQQKEIEQLLVTEQEPHIDYAHLGTCVNISLVTQNYQDALLAHVGPLDLHGITIALDCAHGAFFKIAPAVFRLLGAKVITCGTEPDGTNINAACGSQHLEQLQELVRTERAAIGIAFDGDGDRVCFVTHNGQVRDGDNVLASLSQCPRYADQHTIVGTIMSNEGLATWLATQNKKFVRTAVGDRAVSEQLHATDALLGGEPSGHIIIRDWLPTSDGLGTALVVLEELMRTNNWNMETFERFPHTLINVPVRHKKDLQAEPLASILQEHREQLPQGRFVVRYSGTEPVLRVMVEGPNKNQTTVVAQQLSVALQHHLQ